MNEELTCPNCKVVLERKYGLPAIVYNCKCGREWILSLGKLVDRSEFQKEADAWVF